MLGSPESKPAFLSERNLEPIIKNIVRKFPVIDTRSNSVSGLYESGLKHTKITKIKLISLILCSESFIDLQIIVFIKSSNEN